MNKICSVCAFDVVQFVVLSKLAKFIIYSIVPSVAHWGPAIKCLYYCFLPVVGQMMALMYVSNTLSGSIRSVALMRYIGRCMWLVVRTVLRAFVLVGYQCRGGLLGCFCESFRADILILSPVGVFESTTLGSLLRQISASY